MKAVEAPQTNWLASDDGVGLGLDDADGIGLGAGDALGVVVAPTGDPLVG